MKITAWADKPWLSLAAIIWLLTPQAVSAAPLSALARSQDARLEKHVTLSASRIYIPDLLERLTEQSGVPLLCSEENDGSRDERVSVFLKDVPLADVMNGLYSLLSYRDAEWYWTRSGTDERFRYRFLQSRNAHLLGNTLDRKMQHDFEEHAQHVLDALKLPPDQLLNLLAQDPLASALLSQERSQLALGAFTDSLTEDERLAVLRGRLTITVPVDQLSPRGQRFVQQITKETPPLFSDPTPGGQHPAEPRSISFYVSKVSRSIAPLLIVSVDNRGGYGYLGGRVLASSYLDSLQKQWTLPGDTAAGASSDVKISESKDEAEARPSYARMDRRLSELSDGVPISLMARLGLRAGDEPGSPVGRTLAQYIATLSSDPLHLQFKVRSRLLLVVDPSWFRGRSLHLTVPYKVVKRLRSAELSQKGYLALPDLAAAADELDAEQLTGLAEEFPVMQSVARWQPVFRTFQRLSAANRQVVETRGLSLTSTPGLISSLSCVPFDALLAGAGSRATAFRIVVAKGPNSVPPTQVVRIQLLSRDGAVVLSGGFLMKKRISGNLCFNGGFEDTDDNPVRPAPADWSPVGGNPAEALLSPQARTGQYSARLRSDDNAPVGINWFGKGLKAGTVRLWYLARQSSVQGDNLCVYLIPMREVGGKLEEATSPNGASARLRIRMDRGHIGDGKWHQLNIPFDFLKLKADHMILAPRINEFTPQTGSGELLLDDVEVIPGTGMAR